MKVDVKLREAIEERHEGICCKENLDTYEQYARKFLRGYSKVNFTAELKQGLEKKSNTLLQKFPVELRNSIKTVRTGQSIVKVTLDYLQDEVDALRLIMPYCVDLTGKAVLDKNTLVVLYFLLVQQQETETAGLVLDVLEYYVCTAIMQDTVKINKFAVSKPTNTPGFTRKLCTYERPLFLAKDKTLGVMQVNPAYINDTYCITTSTINLWVMYAMLVYMQTEDFETLDKCLNLPANSPVHEKIKEEVGKITPFILPECLNHSMPLFLQGNFRTMADTTASKVLKYNRQVQKKAMGLSAMDKLNMLSLQQEFDSIKVSLFGYVINELQGIAESIDSDFDIDFITDNCVFFHMTNVDENTFANASIDTYIQPVTAYISTEELSVEDIIDCMIDDTLF